MSPSNPTQKIHENNVDETRSFLGLPKHYNFRCEKQGKQMGHYKKIENCKKCGEINCQGKCSTCECEKEYKNESQVSNKVDVRETLNVQALDEKIVSLEEKIEILKHEHKSELANYEWMKATENKEIIDLQARVNKLISEKSNLVIERNNYKHVNKELEATNSALESQKNVWKTHNERCEKIESAYNEIEPKYQHLKNDNQMLINANQVLKSKVNSQSVVIDGLKIDIGILEKEILDQKNWILQQEHQIKILKNIKNNLESETQEKEDERKALESSVAFLEPKCKELMVFANNDKATKQALEDEIGKLRRSNRKLSQNYRELDCDFSGYKSASRDFFKIMSKR